MSDSTSQPSVTALQWDVFCRVIDNFGDIGVCWRLCADLLARGHRVRLWVDDASALRWMAPGALDGVGLGVEVRNWEDSKNPALLAELPLADVWVEGFGCEIATEFIAAYAYSAGGRCQNDAIRPVWINLEYLSAESYVERCHALPSPVMSGPAKGWTKHFYYPGFTERTGGVLRELGLPERIRDFQHSSQGIQWLAQHGIAWAGERLVSLFCYEPAALSALLKGLDALSKPTLLLVTAGRASAAVQTLTRDVQSLRHVRVVYLPQLTQTQYDELLWTCDFNCVRGEDSLVRALWAGKPFLWHVYPQDDLAHVNKLDAFLDCLQAPPTLRALHHAWNHTMWVPTQDWELEPLLSEMESWQPALQTLRQRLLGMDDLLTQLLRFVSKTR